MGVGLGEPPNTRQTFWLTAATAKCLPIKIGLAGSRAELSIVRRHCFPGFARLALFFGCELSSPPFGFMVSTMSFATSSPRAESKPSLSPRCAQISDKARRKESPLLPTCLMAGSKNSVSLSAPHATMCTFACSFKSVVARSFKLATHRRQSCFSLGKLVQGHLHFVPWGGL